MHLDEINLINLQVLWALWDHLECVYEHVPRKEDVEVTEPQELSAMAKHGLLKRKDGCLRGYITNTSTNAQNLMSSVNASTSFHYISMMRLLESAKNMCSFYVTCLCQQSVYFEAYFGLPVAP